MVLFFIFSDKNYDEATMAQMREMEKDVSVFREEP